MKTFEKLIYRHIQGKKVLLLFTVTTIVYLLMVLLTIPKVMAYSNGMPVLDMLPMGYDMEYITKLFDALGAEGRNIYRYRQIPLDMLYPFLFAICYCLVLGFFLNKANKLKTPLRYLCLLPLFIGIMDYAENIGIFTMLGSYPDISNGAATATVIFSVLKSLGTSFYFVILIVVLITWGYQTLKNGSIRN